MGLPDDAGAAAPARPGCMERIQDAEVLIDTKFEILERMNDEERGARSGREERPVPPRPGPRTARGEPRRAAVDASTTRTRRFQEEVSRSHLQYQVDQPAAGGRREQDRPQPRCREPHRAGARRDRAGDPRAAPRGRRARGARAARARSGGAARDRNARAAGGVPRAAAAGGARRTAARGAPAPGRPRRRAPRSRWRTYGHASSARRIRRRTSMRG